ncbi:unnamed protein product [Ectocarpus sp. CCAP 1310/34]|nr:unnamed protein product [Ectocarpus sp. CCAP 1310/34]
MASSHETSVPKWNPPSAAASGDRARQGRHQQPTGKLFSGPKDVWGNRSTTSSSVFGCLFLQYSMPLLLHPPILQGKMFLH